MRGILADKWTIDGQRRSRESSITRRFRGFRLWKKYFRHVKVGRVRWHSTPQLISETRLSLPSLETVDTLSAQSSRNRRWKLPRSRSRPVKRAKWTIGIMIRFDFTWKRFFLDIFRRFTLFVLSSPPFSSRVSQKPFFLAYSRWSNEENWWKTMKSGLNPLSTASTKLCIVLEPAAAAHFARFSPPIKLWVSSLLMEDENRRGKHFRDAEFSLSAAQSDDRRCLFKENLRRGSWHDFETGTDCCAAPTRKRRERNKWLRSRNCARGRRENEESCFLMRWKATAKEINRLGQSADSLSY